MTATQFIYSAGFFFISFAALSGCEDNKKSKEVFPNSDMYDLSNPVIINLPVELDEISGIAYYPKDTSVFAVIDEDGLLYKIPIKDPSQTQKWVFDKARDYEDLILKDSLFYALVSNGDIVTIVFNGDSITTKKSVFSEESGKKTNEFEGMYLDSNRIVIMCKECEEDKKSKISFYQFIDSLENYQLHHALDIAPVAEKLDKNKVALKPSAVALHPITRELYIVSAINKVLLVVDTTGKIKDIFPLNPKIYKQPEGIAFTPQGDLIISNEVFLENHATLLILKNKNK